MSMSNCKVYFRQILNGLGYTEHQTGFDFLNLPNNMVNKSYHLNYGPVAGGPVNQADQQTDVSMVVRLFYDGYNDVDGVIDSSIDATETVIKQCCSIENRLNNSLCIKNVTFEGFLIEPRALSNDNQMVIEMDFTVNYWFELV